MDPRQAVVLLGLLLLLTDWGQAEGPGDLDGDQNLTVSERPSSRSPSSSAWAQPCARGPQPPEATPTPGSGAQGTVSSFSRAPLPQEEDGGPGPARDTQPSRVLLHTLLQAMERPGRSPAFLFQPQRFGRNAQGPWSKQRLSPRAGEGLSSQFWSLAAPQRFGKK